MPRAATGRDGECVFCDILADGRPAQVVYESPEIVAFLDQRPLFPGHTLVIPRVHVVTLREVPAPLLASFFTEVQRVAAAVEDGVGADGTFVAENNVVSQSVPHLHVHVVPRRRKDGLRGFFWPRQRYADEAEAGTVAARIRSALLTT